MKTGTSATETAICGSRATTSGVSDAPTATPRMVRAPTEIDAEIPERRPGQRRDEAGEERAEQERKRQPEAQNAAVPARPAPP
jgi:hypothetical protein